MQCSDLFLHLDVPSVVELGLKNPVLFLEYAQFEKKSSFFPTEFCGGLSLQIGRRKLVIVFSN